MKHRMLEFLVSEMGFTLFTIEAAFPESLAVNRYVLTGEGDARHSLTSMQPYCWDCEEVLDQIEWMRRWNAEHDQKVSFYGFDLQTSWPAAIFALKYLKEHDSAAYGRLREPLQLLASDWWGLNWISRSNAEKDDARAAVAETKAILADLSANGSDEATATLVRLHGEVLSQVVQLVGDSSADLKTIQGLRDRAMAENFAALLKMHGPDAKAVVWAHNGHVQLKTHGEFGFEGGTKTMGEHLRAMFGDDYRVFGFGFDHGSLTALDEARRLHTPSVSSTPGSLDAVLAEAAPAICALNLRSVPDEVGDWLAQGPLSLDIGGLWYPGSGLEAWTKTDIREHYDALLFVREMTPSRHNAPYQIEWFRQDPPHELPINLDFNSGLDGWNRHAQPAVGAYHVDVVAQGGTNVLELSRSEALWPWDIFAVRQSVSAEPWRGQQITVHCDASIQATHPGSSAQLGVRASQNLPEDYKTDWATATQKTMERFVWQRMVTLEAETRRLSLTVDVAEDADTFEIALVITGDGTARFGPVTIEEGI